METNNTNNNKYRRNVIDSFGTEIHEVSADEMSVPLVFIDRNKLESQHFYLFVKRCFDIVVSLIAGLILLVPTLILALIIFIDDPHGSPFFAQDRVGKNGKLFRFYKLRSMHVNAEEELGELLKQSDNLNGPAFKMKDDPRITRVGKFIRATGIDEIPQLLNIFLGQMSIVGPRPALPRELAEYNSYIFQRLLTVPGLTCYWQVYPERNKLDFASWVYLDLEYIQNRSFRVDLKIIFKTFSAVFHGYGW